MQYAMVSVSACRCGCACVYLEVRDAVAFPEGDLEHFQVGDEGSQSSEALLAAAAYADQKSVTTWRLQDTVDTATTGGGRERGRGIKR